MSPIAIQYLDGAPYAVVPLPRLPVYVCDRQRSSDARAPAHLGHALLVARLEPVRPLSPPMLRVRLPDGTLRDVVDTRVASAANLATRRLLPPADAPAPRLPWRAGA